MFVGRPAELAQIDELLAGAAAGYGGLLLLTGDPGVGKSAVIEAAVRRARRSGVQTASVRAVAVAPGSLLLAGDLLRALGAPSAPTGGPVADGDMAAELVAALVRWVNGSASLLTVDDFTAADEASATAVVAAVSRATDLPLAVLITGNRADLESRLTDQVRAALRRWPVCRMEPLDAAAASAVARAALGPDASERTVTGLVSARHGNPGAIHDTARLLAPEEVSGVMPLPDPLPMSATVWRPWTAALDGLSPTTREAVSILAVIDSTRFDLLTAVLQKCGCDEAMLEEAADAGLIRCNAQGVPDIAQPLLRAAIVAGMAPSRYRALHRTAAQAADRLQLPPATIVAHLTASATGPDAAIADALHEQARRVRFAGDAHGAAQAEASAARLTPEPEVRRARILRAVQDRMDCINDPGSVADLLQLLGPDPVPDELAAWVTWLRASVEPDLALAATQQALAVQEARTHTPDLLPGLLRDAASSAWALGDPRAAMEAIEERTRALACGVASERSEPPWTDLALRAAGLFQLGEVGASVDLRAQALERADQLDPLGCPLDTLMAAVDIDDLLLADTPGSRSRVAVALQRCAPGTAWMPCLWGIAAWQARARGDWGSAQLLIHDGLALSHDMSAIWPLNGLLAVSVELAALQGDTERLAKHGTALRDLGVWSSDRRRLAILDRATGMAALAAGSLDVAAASLMQAADVPFLSRGLRDAVIPSRVDVVEVLRRLDRIEEACQRADALHPILAAMDQPLAHAWDERVQALVSDAEDADAHYEAALRMHAAAPDPLEAGRTELLYGEHLRRTRRRAQARAHLARAEGHFARMRATPWLERARQELRVAGTPRGVGPSRRPALTPQEANIAEAVAQGRSTREVAELLVLSPRTVETHLSSVYRKLGVTGRGALPKALGQVQ